MKTTLAILFVLALLGCTLATEAIRAIGIPIGPGVGDAAAQVDAAISTWFQNLLFMGIGAGTSEGTRAVAKFRARHKAKKLQPTPDPRPIP